MTILRHKTLLAAAVVLALTSGLVTSASAQATYDSPSCIGTLPIMGMQSSAIYGPAQFNACLSDAEGTTES